MSVSTEMRASTDLGDELKAMDKPPSQKAESPQKARYKAPHKKVRGVWKEVTHKVNKVHAQKLLSSLMNDDKPPVKDTKRRGSLKAKETVMVVPKAVERRRKH